MKIKIMPFLEKHKALVTTFLVIGVFVLLLLQVKLSSSIALREQVFYELEFEEPEDTETLFEELTEAEQRIIETHRAFNEAEDIKPQRDNVREKSVDEQLLEELENEREMLFAENKTNNNPQIYTSTIQDTKKERPKSKPVEKNIPENETIAAANKNTSNYYHLENRQIRNFPNPVYTCNTSGKIVINITVDKYGKVTEVAFNEVSSTSFNRCLIEHALDYARNAVFSADVSKDKQIGTITYFFPGQGRN